MTRTRLAAALALTLAAVFPAAALEIPLGGATPTSGGTGGTSVGYVDMDRIFQIFPQTNIAKEDYMKTLQKKRDQLADKEARVNNLKSRISVLESALKDLSTPGAAQPVASSGTATDVNSSTSALASAAPAPAGASPQALEDLKKQLETETAEYDDMRKQADRDLSTFQGQQSQIILGKIYQALRDLAQEEQVTLVVDKASILYGDSAIDLTDKLQAKVRGY